MTRAFLPCESEQWSRDRDYFILLSKLKSPKEFKELVDEHTARPEAREVSVSQRLSFLKGLVFFLTEIATKEEADVFFEKTLPFICRSASCLEALIPEEGVPYLQQQEAASVWLGRKLVLSLTANAFLCTFPSEHPLGRKNHKPFSFKHFFDVLQSDDKSRQSSQSAKLRCILNYFFQMSLREEEGNPGTISYTRQMIQENQLPLIPDWKSSEYPLCTVSIEKNKSIEDSGSRTLQVDFAASHIGGGVLGGGRVQEEIRFCICPELLVSMLIMDSMASNEAIIISGYERFSCYEGYAGTLKYAGSYQDPSEKDVFGNINTSLVAIDALNFQGKFKVEEQYREDVVLRELNKAFVGFTCKDERGDLIMNQIALHQGEYANDEEMLEINSVLTADDDDLEEDPKNSDTLEGFITSLTDSIVTEIMTDVKGQEDKTTSTVHSYADNLASDILTSVRSGLSQPVVLTSSSDVIQTQALPTSESFDEPETPRSRSSSYTGEQMLPLEFVDTIVEEAIKTGVEKAGTTQPLTPSPSVSPAPDVLAAETTAEQVVTGAVESAILSVTPKKTVIGKTFKIGSSGKKKKGHKSKGSHLRQTSGGNPRLITKPFSETDGGDFLDPLALQPSSSRMSIAWSTTSTRDDGSMPPSPTELDSIALRMVENLDDYSSMLAEIIIRDALSYLKLPEDLDDHLNSHKYEVDNSKGLSKIDTFLYSLEKAGSELSLDVVHEGMVPFSPHWYNIQKDTLRPVATGNWGCGAFKGDPQLKSMLQWMAVSACGRPELKYHTFKDARVDKLSEVVKKLSSGGVTTVGQLSHIVLDYCSKRITGATVDSLFNYILSN